VNLAVALPVVIRRRGLPLVLGKLRSHSSDGSFVRFFYWALEASAYERRLSIKAYRSWRRWADVPIEIEHSLPTVKVVLNGAGGTDAQVRACIQSIVAQTHRPWELVVVGANQIDLGTDDARVVAADEAAPSHGAQTILYCDSRCVLAQTAIAELLSVYQRAVADLVYCDEDRISDGERLEPYFKPAFSIDLLRSEDYIGPVFLVRPDTSVASSPFEICLRAFEERRRVVHLPRPLVHWQCPRRLTLDDEKKALVDQHLMRLYGSTRAAALTNHVPAIDHDCISVIIPTKDRIDLLEACLDSIYRVPMQTPFEVIVLDNNSELSSSLRWLDDAAARFPRLRVERAPYPFNWSKLNNHGIGLASGNVLLLLNNDVVVINQVWLDRIAAHCVRPDVGTVGGLLLYPDGSIQHAGVVIGIGGFADHVYAGCVTSERDRHLMPSPFVARNVLASTGACLAVPRRVLNSIGAFDEGLKICGDVEFCLRAHRHGLLNVYDPGIRLFHHESATRPRTPLPTEEMEYARKRCNELVSGDDPFYNSSLTRRLRYPWYSRAP
jgi:GT2 family glycosyltransferase